jgi:hypothetical protein
MIHVRIRESCFFGPSKNFNAFRLGFAKNAVLDRLAVPGDGAKTHAYYVDETSTAL